MSLHNKYGIHIDRYGPKGHGHRKKDNIYARELPQDIYCNCTVIVQELTVIKINNGFNYAGREGNVKNCSKFNDSSSQNVVESWLAVT